MSDYLVEASPNNPIFIDHHDEPSEPEQMNYNMFCKTKQSDNKRQFKLIGTQESSHPARFDFDGDQVSIQLHQAVSPQGGKVHTRYDGPSLQAIKIFTSMTMLKTKIPSRLH
jgi:hypothetical protein